MKKNSYVLRTENVSMQFGGLRAVNSVTMQVTQGTIHGLMGPNGAGKSTLFNIISGIYTPTEGQVYLQDENITKLRAYEVTERGVARTFQNILLFDSATAIDNVMIGQHTRLKSNLALDILQLPNTRRQEKEAREKAESILEFLGMKDSMNQYASNFSYGRKRILEIGRALASQPKVLMLDEPAAGMNIGEASELMDTICRIRDMGITVVLVEHNMKVVMELCDTITVLDHGEHVITGNPETVRANSRVIEAYLGKEDS